MPLIKRGTIERRSYQEEIFENCKDINSLIVLPTGLGKTIIAAMLAAHRLLVDPTSKVVFLAPTRPLAKQHKDTFLRVLDIPFENLCLLTGEVKRKARASIWRSARVVFATPQVVAIDLSRNEYNLRNVSLIVFDEAHRAIGNYPYVRIAQDYFKQAKNPQTVGLTASPGWSQEEVSEIQRILKSEHLEARNETSMDVAHFVQPLEIQWVRVQLGPELKLISRLIDEMMDERLGALLQYGLIQEENLRWRSRRAMVDLQAELRAEISKGRTAAPMAYFQGLTLAAQVTRLSYCEELLNTQGLSALRNHMIKLVLESKSPRSSNALMQLVSDPRFTAVLDTVKNLLDRGIEHPKLAELLRILKEEVNRKPDSRILVFAQIRDSVNRIVHELRKEGISSSTFVGHGKGSRSCGMTQVKQAKILRDFKDGLFSALVATSVAEEGLDMAECDLVVMYDAVASEVRYIQRRGRVSRRREGRVITLIAAGTQDEKYYLSAVSREKKMRDTISRVKEEETMKIEDFVLGKPNIKSENPESKVIDRCETNPRGRSAHSEKGSGEEQLVPMIRSKDQMRTVILDKNLENTQMYSKLKEKGLNPILRSTIAADYIIGGEVGIIHVRYEGSRNNKEEFERLCQRTDLLKEIFAVPLLISEQTKLSNESFRDKYDTAHLMAAYFTLVKRVHFLEASNEDDAVNLMRGLASVSP
jgi:Fanconi anemia group M protein